MSVKAQLGAVALLAVVLAGCGGGDEDLPPLDTGESPGSSASPSSGSAPATTGPADEGRARLAVAREAPGGSAEKKVYEAYLAYWEAYVEALADPAKNTTKNYEKLSDVVVNPQLRRTVADLEKMRTAGEKSIGTLGLAPEVGAVQKGRAVIRDCFDDTSMKTVGKDGDTAGDADTQGKRQRVDVEMTLVKDAWVVADIQGGTGTC